MGEQLAEVIELHTAASTHAGASFEFDGTAALARFAADNVFSTQTTRHLSLVPSLFDRPDVVLPIVPPPEAETYGRSLSTIRRLGYFMIGKRLQEIIASPEADQARVEFYTSVEEGFGTDMELGGGLEVRDFDRRVVIGGKIMAKDLKTAVSSMTEGGITCAEETAKKDRRFLPQLARSVWDHDNALQVDAMARGETGYNTRIVVSPFPEEAAAQSGSEYWRKIGYVPHLKRGFVQLYFAGTSEVVTGSLSFDGSNKQRLREVFADHDIEIPEDEITDNWLSYAITDNLTEEDARALATAIADALADPSLEKKTNTVDVTAEYKTIMDQVFDESYVHICESLVRGRQTEETSDLVRQLARNTRHFNDRYKKALARMTDSKNSFIADDAAVLHELLVYSTIEMMRAFHLQKTKPHAIQRSTTHLVAPMNASAMQTIDPSAFRVMLSDFGADGAKNNRSYSACGLAISLGDELGELPDLANMFNNNPQTVFGGVTTDEEKAKNKMEGETDEFGPLEFECTEGCKNTRERGKLISECKNKKYGCKGSVGCK